MAKQVTFSVSKKGMEGVEVTFSAPESLSDPRWNELVSKPEEDVNELAVQNLVIKIQSGARNRLEGGQEKVQEFVDNYKYGARQPGTGGGGKKVTLAAAEVKKAKFSPEQIEMLKAAGVVIPEEDSPAKAS